MLPGGSAFIGSATVNATYSPIAVAHAIVMIGAIPAMVIAGRCYSAAARRSPLAAAAEWSGLSALPWRARDMRMT